MMTRRYLVVYEKGARNWSGYSPQVPGCISIGDTLEHMRAMMTEALEFHLGSMAKDGDLIPDAVDSTVDFAADAPENAVEFYHVEWLHVRISPQFAGTPVDRSQLLSEQDAISGSEIYAGALRNALTLAGIQHP